MSPSLQRLECVISIIFKTIVKVNIHFLKVHLVTVNSMCKYSYDFGSTMVCFYLYLDFWLCFNSQYSSRDGTTWDIFNGLILPILDLAKYECSTFIVNLEAQANGVWGFKWWGVFVYFKHQGLKFITSLPCILVLIYCIVWVPLHIWQISLPILSFNYLQKTWFFEVWSNLDIFLFSTVLL